jgi:hypothetical protein
VATTTDYVTSLQNQFLENFRRSQQAVVDSIGVWAESVEKAAPDASRRTVGGRFSSAEEIVDNTFDFAESLLGAQRQFAKKVLSVTASGYKEAERKVEPDRSPKKTTAAGTR